MNIMSALKRRKKDTYTLAKKVVFMILCFVILNYCHGLSAKVLAEEISFNNTGGENEGLVPEIYIGNKKTANSNNIFYTKDDVTIEMPDGEDIRAVKDIVDRTLIEIKNSYPEEEIKMSVDKYFAMSMYDNEEFSNYEEINRFIFLKPSEKGNSERHVLRFKEILSYKFYIEIKDRTDGSVSANSVGDNSEQVVKLVDITLKSDIYQFIFDNENPVIKVNDDIHSGIFVDEGRIVTAKITDNEGLDTIVITRNDKEIERISLKGDTRIINYEYDISLISETDKDMISIVAMDLSGNETEYYFYYKADDLVPVISASGVEFGKIYADKTELSISAEDNSESLKLFYKCIFTGEDGVEKCIEDKTYEEGEKIKINREYMEDGIYDVISFAYDDTGNYSETVRLSFAVDSKAPGTFIDNYEYGRLYNEPVSVLANVKEMFYENTIVDFSGTISDVSGTRSLSLPAYEIKSKSNKNIYTFSDEGTYNIKLSAKDQVLHSSQSEGTFTIDRTAPLVDVRISDSLVNEIVVTNQFDIVDKSKSEIYKRIPDIYVETSDLYSEYSVTTGLYRKEKNGSFRETDSSKVVSIGKNAIFSVPVSEQGEYLLKITAVDLAGNVNDKSYYFVIDENPPIIGYVNDFNQKYLKNFNLPRGFENYITDMTNVKYRAYLNSKEIANCDVYKDGKYLLQIVAEDEAGNKSESVTAFIVDNTLPKIIVNGLNDDGNIIKDGEIRLTLFDGEDFFKEAIVNGKTVDIIDGKEVVVKASEYGDYDISVTAADYAGNIVTQEVKASCALASNPFSVSIKKDDIKTLTKNEDEIHETFFEKINSIRFPLFCAIFFICAFAFLGFALFDMKRI